MVKNPNAAVAAGGSTLSVLVVWLLGHFGVALSAEDGAIVAGAVAAGALYLGREGVHGLWRRIMDGDGEAGRITVIEVIVLAICIALLIILLKQV